MANKMQFIFDYISYLDNISINESDDKYIFEQIKKNSFNNRLVLTEGLIYSQPIETTVRIIKNRFNYLEIEVSDENDILISNLVKPLNKYIPIITNMGYYISEYTNDGDNWLKEIDEKETPLAMYIEPKYDLEIKDIPKTLYHVSLLKYKDSILKRGLFPKSKSKLPYHPERIYLTNSLERAYQFGKYLEVENSDDFNYDGYGIFSIDTKDMNKLYSDMNLRDGGYYIMNNINPNNISLTKEIKK